MIVKKADDGAGPFYEALKSSRFCHLEQLSQGVNRGLF